MQVENRGFLVPLATAICEHGRDIGYNLSAGLALHLADSSACRQTGLGFGVDAELVGLDQLGTAVRGLLGDAMTRIESSLFADA